jgi:hypothetical protein
MSEVSIDVRRYDVVDVLKKLNDEFPYLKFVTEDRVLRVGLGEYNHHIFMLKRLNKNTFETPIKTSISLRENETLMEDEYQKISRKIYESFEELVPKIAVND